MRGRVSLQASLAAIFGLLALGLALAASATAERIVRAELEDRIGQELADYAGYLRQRLDGGVAAQVKLMQTLAGMAREMDLAVGASVGPGVPARTWRTWLDAVHRSHPDYAWLGFADTAGTVVASTDGLLTGETLASRPWFRGGLTGLYVGDVHDAILLAKRLPPLPGGEPLRFVDVAAPVLDAGGAVLGVLGGHLSWTWARQVERSVLAPLEGRRGGVEALIMSQDGEILLGPAPLTGRRLDQGLRERVAGVGAAQTNGHVLAQWPDEGTYLVGTSASSAVGSYAGLGWTVIVRQPVGIAFAPITSLSRAIFVWGCALAIPFALLGFVLATFATRPLLSLVDFTERHRRGEHGVPMPTGAYAEVNALSYALQLLLSDLSARDAALASNTRALEQRVEERTRELTNASALTRKIIENSPDVIIVVSPEGRIEFTSRVVHWIAADASPEQVKDRALLSVFPPSCHAEMMAAMLQACHDEPIEMQVHCPRDDDPGLWLDVLLTFMHDHRSQAERLLCIVRDVTAEHRRAELQRLGAEQAERSREEAVAASQAKSDFLASMSHEIRTPLNAIIGFTGLILDRDDLKPDLARQVGLIQSSGNALLTVVNDVLDFSKVEAGAIALEPVPFSPRGLVENTLAIVRGQADAKGLTLAFEADEAVPAWLVGDEDRLRQILLNLVNNAIKFTREGSVTVRLGSPGGELGGVRVAFSVADTGIGIPSDKRDRLFQRFSQVDGSIRREFGGTGLGLAISQRLVEMMGGEITVTSEPWAGSTFSFALNLPLGTDPGRPEVPREAVSARPRPARILLAEDIEVNQEIARAILESAGHSVDVVGDGAAALEAVEHGTYDVVLMDIQMPIMDGLAAAARIRGLSSPAGRVPIIALTANVLADQIVALRRAGMDDHVGKPFRRADLLRAVERCRRVEEAATPDPALAEPRAAVLDRTVLDELVALGGPVQVASWLSALDERIAATHLRDGVAAEPHGANHALVSQAGMLGFVALSDACRALEAAAFAREEADAAATDADLAAARARCREAASEALAVLRDTLAGMAAAGPVARVA